MCAIGIAPSVARPCESLADASSGGPSFVAPSPVGTRAPLQWVWLRTSARKLVRSVAEQFQLSRPGSRSFQIVSAKNQRFISAGELQGIGRSVPLRRNERDEVSRLNVQSWHTPVSSVG